MKTIVAAAAIAIATLSPALGAAPVPYLPIPKGAAVILDTGSTNSTGYRIVIQSNGFAEYVSGQTRATAHVSLDVASKFFADMQAAMPLSHVRIEPCMKSASFGSMTFLWWRGQRSPDISCPGDATSKKLYEDAAAVAAALHLGGGHTVDMLPNEPRQPMPASPASASPMSLRLTARAF
jgi:hypothetical protein